MPLSSTKSIRSPNPDRLFSSGDQTLLPIVFPACAKKSTSLLFIRFLVRGLNKVTCVVLIASIASNLLAHGHKLLGMIG